MSLHKRIERLEQSSTVRIEIACASGDFETLSADELNQAVSILEQRSDAGLRACGLNDDEMRVWKLCYYLKLDPARQAEVLEMRGGPPVLSEHDKEVWRQLEARMAAEDAEQAKEMTDEQRRNRSAQGR